MRLFFYTTFLSILLGCQPLRALEFRVMSWEGSISGLFYDNAGAPVELSAEEGMLSIPHQVNIEKETLKLYREESHDGKTVKAVVATLPVPPDLKQAILVLAPIDSTRKTYTGLWLNDSPDVRPVNTIQYYNFSRRNVAVQSPSSQWLIPPQKAQGVPFEATTRSLPLKIAAQTESGWELVSTNRQPVRDGYRILVFLRDGRRQTDGTQRAVELVRLYDLAPSTATP